MADFTDSEVEVKGTSSVSYVMLAEYRAYLKDNLGVTSLQNVAAGEDAEDDKDKFHLRRAARMLDAGWHWKGIRTGGADSDQQMEFPRQIEFDEFPDGEVDADVNVITRNVDNDVIPRDIKAAQCELAYAIRTGVDITPVQTGGVIKKQDLQAGSIRTSTEYGETFVVPFVSAVETLVSKWHRGRTISISEAPIIRG